jgi:hypothetical protein
VFSRLLLLCSVLNCAFAASKPIWAKGAIPIINCSAEMRHSERGAKRWIPSPDGNTTIEMQCREVENEPVAYLRVETASNQWHDLVLDEGAYELLWSPDSRAFLVNGAPSGYAGFFVSVYLVSPTTIRKLPVEFTSAIQADMAATFPPCKAIGIDKNECGEIARSEGFNVSGIAWVDGSSAIVAFAEVPCSSRYGGIMCAVQGYQIDVPTGTIVGRMTARQLKSRWQTSMAFKMRIPEPPEYEAAQ